MIIGTILFLLVFFMLVYIKNYYHENKKIVIFLKVLTSFFFCILGLYCFKNTMALEDGDIFVLYGLILGLFGDLIFGLKSIFINKKEEYYVLGMFLFFIGHISYSYSFYEKGNLILITLISLVIFSITIHILKKTAVNFGRVRIFSYIYILLCSFLLVVVGANFSLKNYQEFMLPFLGILLFVSSDMMLCYLYFKEMKQPTYKKIKVLNIVTYYFGQALIALSLLV